MTAVIRRIPLSGWQDPAAVFTALHRNDSHAFWLDAGPGSTTGASYMGAASARSRLVTESVAAGTVTVTVPADPATPPATTHRSVFDLFRDELPAGSPMDGTGGFRLGWVGWLGYELGARALGAPVDPSPHPDAAFLEVDRVVAFDHAARSVTLLALERPGEDDGQILSWADTVASALRRPSVPVPPVPAPTAADRGPTVRWRHGPGDYARLIGRCQDAIRRGDAYQLCLTNEILVDTRPDPLDTYLALRASSPSHHGGLLRFGDTALLSSSPEQFLRVTRGGHVTTRPIKGTRPRDRNPERDAALRTELAVSEKERAENLMIVDLMRNDLGRIARLGSVVVPDLLAVESYAHVHQLVSTVEADLAAGVTAIDAIVSCFPAGSMTGAPKLRATEILHGLEAGPRGIYSGAFGYVGLDGAVDLAMVIRSIVLGPNGASIGTGGGITALSDPDDEIEETRIKAAALLSALGADPGSRTQPPPAV